MPLIAIDGHLNPQQPRPCPRQLKTKTIIIDQTSQVARRNIKFPKILLPGIRYKLEGEKIA